MKFNFTFLALLFSFGLSAQTPRVISGPMLGYAEHRECLVWVETRCALRLNIEYVCESDDKLKGSEVIKLKHGDHCQPVVSKFVISNLQPGKTYKYKLSLDDQEIKFDYPLKFFTKELWEYRTDPPPFTFIAGSCAYINDSLYDRPGKPYGQSTSIFKGMAETNSQFMLWLGDNTYLREVDYSSESGIRYRYRHTRRNKDMNKLMATRNNYAIWDDHDFGPNNSCKTFDLKDASLETFKEYWGNRSYGQDGKGIYSRFAWSDCDFFMLDNRYFRDEDNMPDSLLANKTQLGAHQLDWLKQSLLSSRAAFKFVLMGGQFLNVNTDQESYVYFKKERQEILDFITFMRIKGVVFMSGDRHHTEIIKLERVDSNIIRTEEAKALEDDTQKKDKKKEKKKKQEAIESPELSKKDDDDEPTGPKHPYTLYELTCSPMTSGGSNVMKTPEAKNPMRITQTMVDVPNYCQMTVSGKPHKRNLLIKCFDANNELRWEFTINQAELE
ncbi:MAG: alkaline phosphatase family protein [Flavobacteriaceae bacterium]|nr:alkaline phosphatase family protein [Flavobacteriaceae bacterium]